VKEHFYRTGQAGKHLGISSYRVRQLCESGLIPDAELTEGGQWIVPGSQIEKFNREGVPPTPKTVDTAGPTASGNSAARSRRNPNPLIAKPSTDAVDAAEDSFISERKLVADSHQLARMRVRKDAFELGDWFEFREQAKIQRELEEDRRREEYEERQIQQRRAELATEEQERFTAKWISHALTTYKPADAPADFAILIQDDLLSTLARLRPTTSDSVVEAFVKASIASSLRPSRAAEERSQAKRVAVKRALYDLPVRMEWDEDWNTRARNAASDAVGAAREDATASDLVGVAKLAVRPLIAQYRHQENIHSALDSVRLAEASYDDQQDARETVAAALAGLPTGSGDREITQAKEKALSPIRDRIAARIRQQQEDTDHRNKLAAKEQLVRSGLNEVYWHACNMLREFDDYEDETALDIQERVKSEVEKTLRRELSGDEDLETVTQLVHEVMEKCEHCE
jgi:hypothetical protein